MRHNVDKNFKVVTQDVFTNHNILHSCAVSLPDNTVFLIGGGILSHRRVHKETYQIIKSTKVPRADMTVARAGFACSVFPDFTQIFVAGGSVNDLSAVTGNLTLDGTLNVSEIGVGSFLTATAGDTWRLFTYAGTLTNNGLSLGSTPTLSSGLTLAVDTSTPNEVNLIVVPEPATTAAAVLGVGLVAFARMRRRYASSARRD